MIDENAYGLLIAYFGIEDDEYAQEREHFAVRVEAFRACWLECLRGLPLGRGVRAFDLGHALYVELAEDDLIDDPLGWLRMLRARLTGRDFMTVGIITYGGRWLNEDAQSPRDLEQDLGEVTLTQVSLPSEPLRHALDADARTRIDDENEAGWGAGLYVQRDAIEALGRKFKNAPTALEAGGATFFRIAK